MPTPGKVLLLAGLPGSGKTTRGKALLASGWSEFDDFKANAFDHSSAFRKARRFGELLDRLRAGYPCVVADIDFCKTQSRAEAESVIRLELPGVETNWQYFSHDERACAANIKNRNRHSLEADLRRLREYSGEYFIPEGAEVLPVVGVANSMHD